MENTTYGLTEPSDYGDGAQWQETIHLLRLVQSDYQGAREQLEQVSHALAEREALVNQRLQYALLTSGGYQALCLVPYGAGTAVSQMGMSVLGRIARPSISPSITRLEVCCLGRFEVCSAWRSVERWHSVKAKSVFQYLMSRPKEPIIKDVLMETLWP